MIMLVKNQIAHRKRPSLMSRNRKVLFMVNNQGELVFNALKVRKTGIRIRKTGMTGQG